MNAPAVAEIVAAVLRRARLGTAARAALRTLARFGRGASPRGPGPIAHHRRLSAPASQTSIVDGAWNSVRVIAAEYEAGLITDGERYNRILDVWWQARDATDAVQMKPSRGTLGALAATSVAASVTIREVRRTLELASKATSETREVPVLHGLAEGRTAHEVFALATGRPAVRSTGEESLRERLRAAYEAIRIVADDCGATEGLTVASVVHGWYPLSLRLEGRIAAERITAPERVRRRRSAWARHRGRSPARRIDALRIRRVVVQVSHHVSCDGAASARAAMAGTQPAVASPRSARPSEISPRRPSPQRRLRSRHPGSASRESPTVGPPDLSPALRAGIVRSTTVSSLSTVSRIRMAPRAHGSSTATRASRCGTNSGASWCAMRLESGDEITIADGTCVSREGDVFRYILGPHQPFDDLTPWWGGRKNLIGLLDVREPDRPTVFAEADGAGTVHRRHRPWAMSRRRRRSE